MTEPLHDPESLARRLDETIPAGGVGVPHDIADPLVAAAARLANAPHPQTPPDVSARIKAQVMATHYQQKQHHNPGRFRPSFHWAAVASIVALLLIFGLAPVSLASLPGDPLYPLKQVIEWGELRAAGSAEAQAFTHLLHAERRAQEALDLLEKGQVSPDLFAASLSQMAAAAEIARGHESLSASTRLNLQARTAQVNETLNGILNQADQSAILPDSTLVPLMTSVQATQNSGDLLLGTATPTATVSPTVRPDPVTIIVEGAVEAIAGNTITVEQMFIEIDPAHPLLAVIRVGDVARVEGTLVAGRIRAGSIELINVEVDISEDGSQVYREDGIDCSERPPDWAPADGWRALCEGAPMPDDDDTGGPPPGVGPREGAGPPTGVPPG